MCSVCVCVCESYVNCDRIMVCVDNLCFKGHLSQAEHNNVFLYSCIFVSLVLNSIKKKENNDLSESWAILCQVTA